MPTLDSFIAFTTINASLDLVQSHTQKKSVKHLHLFVSIGQLHFQEK